MGSIADIEHPGSYYYRSSKAALNAAMQGLAAKLEPRGIGAPFHNRSCLILLLVSDRGECPGNRWTCL